MTDKPHPTCEQIARKLWGSPLKTERSELYWLCPRHEDQHPSFKINPEKDVWFCGPCGLQGGNWWTLAAFVSGFAPDDRKNIAIWLAEKGFEGESETKRKKSSAPRDRFADSEILREFIYRDAVGIPIAKKTRRGYADPKRDQEIKKAGQAFRWWTWQESAWTPGLGKDKQAALPMYRAGEASQAGKTREEPIILTEGEHDAEAAASLGLQSVSPGGTGTLRQRDIEFLKCRHVVIVGHSGSTAEFADAQTRAALLHKSCGSVRLVFIPNFKDLALAIEAGFSRDLWDILLSETEDWHPPTGRELFAQTRAELRAHTWISEAQEITCALWAWHTHVFDVWDDTPYLHFTSADVSCGKTKTMKLVGCLSANPRVAATISSAAVYRVIQLWRPTLLFDEADNLIRGDSELAQTILGILNSGSSVGSPAIRMVGTGSNMMPEEFDTFGPKAFTAVNKLPSSISSRSIVIKMKPAPPKTLKPFRLRKLQKECTPLQAAIGAWLKPRRAELESLEPEIPEALQFRDADIHMPLLAIAHLLGQDIEKQATDAFLEIYGKTSEDERSIGQELLTDIWKIWLYPQEELLTDPPDKIQSDYVLNELLKMQDRIWPRFHRSGQGLNANDLSRLLKKYDIKANRIWFEDKRLRGYTLAEFIPVWKSSCPWLELPGHPTQNT
jgi:putative DNA primase/helicase